MLPPLALSPAPGSAILDMCASPGGKSSFLAQLAGDGGFVLANEPNGARLVTLRANIARLNLLNIGTSALNGADMPAVIGGWPYILLDAPCSGWGTVKKNPQALRMWRGKKTLPLISLQRRLLARSAELLAPGGHLVYSTCTTNPDENEAQIQYAINNLGLRHIPLKPFPGFVFDNEALENGALLVDGPACASQGFFMALLEKNGTPVPEEPPLEKTECKLCGPLFDPRQFPPGECVEINDKLRFIPSRSSILPPGFPWCGFLLGEIRKGGAFSPQWRLRRGLVPGCDQTLVFQSVSEVRSCLSGISIRTGCKGPLISLWWRELPLGIAQIKGGRVLSTFK